MYLSVIQFQVYVSHLLWPILLLKVCGQNSDVCFHLNTCLFDGLLQLWPPSDSISLILDDIKPSKMSSLWEGGIDNIIPSLSLSTETSIKACVISHYLSVFRRIHSYAVMSLIVLDSRYHRQHYEMQEMGRYNCFKQIVQPVLWVDQVIDSDM